MFHVEGDHLTQARDLVLQRAHGSLQESLQKRGIAVAQFLAQPELARQRGLDIEAVGSAGIKHQAKAQFDHQQRVAQQKATQLGGVEHAFADADQEGFEVGAFRVGRSSQRRALSLPALDDGPIEQREEGAIIGHQGIMIE